MSVYFSVGDRAIWNPASLAGVLFYEQIRTLEHVARRTCGVADAYQIVPDVLTAFLDALLDTM